MTTNAVTGNRADRPLSLDAIQRGPLEIVAQHLQPQDMANLAATCTSLRSLMNACIVDGAGDVVTTGVTTTELRRRFASDPDHLSLREFRMLMSAYETFDRPFRANAPEVHRLAINPLRDSVDSKTVQCIEQASETLKFLSI
jgi:hypothetical protein